MLTQNPESTTYKIKFANSFRNLRNQNLIGLSIKITIDRYSALSSHIETFKRTKRQ